MAEVRDRIGVFEAVGLSKEAVQEWLANPCTLKLKEACSARIQSTKEALITNATHYATVPDDALAGLVKVDVARVEAAKWMNDIFMEADAYASDK